MSSVIINEASLQDIADAIRTKNGTQNTYTPAQMGDAIEALDVSGITPTGTIQITENNTYDVTNYASAAVNVPTGGITPSGSISITENDTYDVTNYASAVVNVPSGGGVQSGTVIGDGTKTMALPTTSLCSNVLCYVYSTDIPTEAAWKCSGFIYLNGEALDMSVYNNGSPAMQRGKPTVSFAANQISVSDTRYNTFTDVTYHWWAW